MSMLVSEAKIRIMAAVGRIGATVTDDELLANINHAIEDGAEGMPYTVAPDETNVTLATDTYEYSLASVDMDLIGVVTMADSSGNFPPINVIGKQLWWVVHGTTPKLTFHESLWTPTNGRVLRIEGQKYQDVVTSDTGTIYMFAPFVVAKAAAMLLGALGSEREYLMLTQAEDARHRSPQRPWPSARRV